MDLSIKSQMYGADDSSWIASRLGLDAARSITLDRSAFTKATHYPDGFIRSGTPLAKLTATNKYVPYDTAGAGGAEVLDGHLLGHVTVDDATTADLGAALFWHGVVEAAHLPLPVDADGRAAVAGRIRYV